MDVNMSGNGLSSNPCDFKNIFADQNYEKGVLTQNTANLCKYSIHNHGFKEKNANFFAEDRLKWQK
jgi:hypothetical protein